jgi:methyl-accepting chemotaxis protein
MERTLTVGRKIGGGFALVLALLGLVAATSYRSTEVLVASGEWVTHTHVVLERLATLISRVAASQSAHRGYVATADEAFLEPGRTARAEVPRLVEELRQLTADNPAQQRRLDVLDTRLPAWFTYSDRVVAARRSEGQDAAVRVIESMEGERLIAEIRALVAQMDGDERALLAHRDAAAAETARATRAAVLGGSTVAVLIAALVGVALTRSLAGQIGSAVQHLQSSATELQASATQQATTAKQQATSTAEITTTMKELLASSRQIAERTQRVARLAEQTGGAAKGGEDSLREAQQGMATIRRQVDLIVEHMLDLGKKSQQIGGVLEIIDELAEQTNILAINATIEAAGASQDGRRFAVVADEIRRLADRVGASTREIRSLVDEIRAAANTTVMATEQGSKATDAGARQFDVVAAGLQQIASLVLDTSDAAREIELSTAQQATAVEQADAAMIEVASSASTVEASSRQTVQVAAELASLSSSLSRLVRSGSGA